MKILPNLWERTSVEHEQNTLKAGNKICLWKFSGLGIEISLGSPWGLSAPCSASQNPSPQLHHCYLFRLWNHSGLGRKKLFPHSPDSPFNHQDSFWSSTVGHRIDPRHFLLPDLSWDIFSLVSQHVPCHGFLEVMVFKHYLWNMHNLNYISRKPQDFSEADMNFRKEK